MFDDNPAQQPYNSSTRSSLKEAAEPHNPVNVKWTDYTLPLDRNFNVHKMKYDYFIVC